jgi:DNA-binding response OmpR family regulator
VILDRLLGHFDAKDLVKPIKNTWQTCSILVLSAINTPDEKSNLLDLGADDYLSKPFSTQELISRINALLRRSNKWNPNFISIGNVMLDLMKRSFTVDGKNHTPPAKEFLVLRLLVQTPGRVFNRGDIFETVWDGNRFAETNVVEATIVQLRRRLERAGANISIKNMRNVGYWVED